MTLTTNLLEEFELFEATAYEAITKHNKKVREATDALEKFVTRNDRNNMATDALEELETFLERLPACIEKEEDRLEAIAVARSSIVERIDVLKRLHIALTTMPKDKTIEEQLNAYYGNEYYWKKELCSDFLDVLASYDVDYDIEKRDYLLSQLSSIVKASIRKVPLSSVAQIADISKMSSENLAEEKKKTRKNITNLIQATVRANNLKVILKKLETEF